MTARWHRTADLAGLPGMPSARAIRRHGPGKGWVSRGARGGGLEWLEDTLPAATREAIRSGRQAPPLRREAMTIADARLEILQSFEQWRSRLDLTLIPAMRLFSSVYSEGGYVSEETRAMVPSFSWNTLQRWRLSLRRGGISDLEAKPGGGRKSAMDPDMEDTAAGLLYDRWPHVSASQILQTLETDFPDRKPPSLRAIQRWMKKWVGQNGRSLSAVANPDGHRSRRKPAFGSASADIVELNQYWELDSTRIDVMCADGKRHALVAAIDVWSRRARCVVAPQSNAAAISALVRRCILEWGVPGMICTDEGADYTSRRLRRVLQDLEIAHHVLPPYSPEKKPFVERFIGTISRGLFSQLPGFVGHSVADREAIRSRQSFAGRRGQERTTVFRCSLPPEQLQERIDAWCDSVYAQSPHTGIGGQTPFARAASWPGVRRDVDPRALDILLAEPAHGDGTCTVGKKGIRVDNGTYIAAEIGDLVGEEVDVRLDPTDWGVVHVFRDGRFLCLAKDEVRLGKDRQAVAAAASARARATDAKARKHARELIKATGADTAMDRVLEKSGRDARRVLAFPAPSEEHSGEMIDAAAEAAAALEEAVPADERDGEAGGENRLIDAFMQHYLGVNHE